MPTNTSQISPDMIDVGEVARYVGLLRQGRTTRVDSARLWSALAEVFPHRRPGPAERQLLLVVLQAAADAGELRLPPANGRRWDRSLSPPVPASVDLSIAADPPDSAGWRSYPWHQKLSWVPEMPRLTARQALFLCRVHEGLVQGWFAELAPLKYRSLQLAGGEKDLAELMTSSLFGAGRLSLDTLNCAPEILPLSWEPVGEGGRAVVFENAGAFAVARRVLAELPGRPYDLVVYGGGRSVLASLPHLVTIGREVKSLDYVGDLDAAGLEIASAVQDVARLVGLPEVRLADGLYRAMLQAAAGLGHPEGWPIAGGGRTVTAEKADELVRGLCPEQGRRIRDMLVAGRRIPEEVLGPREMRRALGPHQVG